MGLNKTIYIIMGVSGCGKSTIGSLLAKELQIPFYDGDDYHPKKNVLKMKKGNPLNDEDRKGWLQQLNSLAVAHLAQGAVIACSALKEKYRLQLRNGIASQMVFIHLTGTFDEINDRLQERNNHYMPATLLKSQFDALEPPKHAISITINNAPSAIVSEIMERAKQKKP